MPLPRRRLDASDNQPTLPLDLGAATLPAPRAPRARSRPRAEGPVQLTLGVGEEDEAAPAVSGQPPAVETSPLITHPSPLIPEEIEAEAPEFEPPEFEPDPFVDIPGFTPAAPVAGEFVLLPASLRGRLDLRELTRFLGALPTVVRDWEGAPEMDEGGLRLRGPEGGAWIYPETNRVRLVLDGAVDRRVAEDLVALCRWLEARAGMRLYPAGETSGAGVDRSLDAWETFLGGF